MTMTNEELHELAAAGVSQRIHAIEQQLATYHRGWPELFASPTPPQLLKIPMNGNGASGNGHKPAAAAPPTTAGSVFDAPPAMPRRRRKMSRKARAAISAAQKARWAKQKASKRRGANA